MGNKIYCHPLTIADSKSRFLFTAKGHYAETFKAVKSEFINIFRKYGIPQQIHTDNGSPFGSVRAIQRYTQLSYWFIELGILPVFSDPAQDLKAQQRRLNGFVKEYNHIRPHEALGMETPASVHQFSTRSYPESIPSFDYNSNLKVMKVTQNGAVRWKTHHWVFQRTALKGKYVGIEDIGNGIWRVFYRNVFLGFFDDKNIRNKQVSIRLSQNLV